MNIYQEHILDHYKNPRNVGEIEGAKTARELNPLCGDEVDAYVLLQGPSRLRQAQRPVQEIKHITKGCSITVASASILSEELLGKTETEVGSLTEQDVTDILNTELTPARIKCAMLPLWTIKKALQKK